MHEGSCRRPVRVGGWDRLVSSSASVAIRRRVDYAKAANLFPLAAFLVFSCAAPAPEPARPRHTRRHDLRRVAAARLMPATSASSATGSPRCRAAARRRRRLPRSTRAGWRWRARLHHMLTGRRNRNLIADGRGQRHPPWRHARVMGEAIRWARERGDEEREPGVRPTYATRSADHLVRLSLLPRSQGRLSPTSPASSARRRAHPRARP